jgi:hypothetical protein
MIYDKPCPLFIWKKKQSHDGGFVFGGMAVSQAHKDLNWFSNTLECEVKQLSKLRYPGNRPFGFGVKRAIGIKNENVPRKIESEHDCLSLKNILILVVKTVGVSE